LPPDVKFGIAVSWYRDPISHNSFPGAKLEPNCSDAPGVEIVARPFSATAGKASLLEFQAKQFQPK
jgi:hypothetical protein